MEWNSIKMSKAEFERLQKEYTEAAMKAAEKAKHSQPTKEVSIEAPRSVPPVHTITQAVLAPSNESADVPEPVENEITETTDIYENDIDISAEAAEYSAEQNSAGTEPETPDNDETSDCDEDAETPQDTSDFQQAEEICNSESTKTDDSDDCGTEEEHTDEEILDSFASVFMSEDEADKKVEKLSADRQKSCPPPSFNTAIHNHNKSMSNNKKPCGCEHCRCQSGSHMQEKGGHKPD